MSIPDDIVDHSGTKGLTRKTKQAFNVEDRKNFISS